MNWIEKVSESRGDLICQVAMARLKATVLTLKEHKLPIVVIVSMEGVKIIAEKSQVQYAGFDNVIVIRRGAK